MTSDSWLKLSINVVSLRVSRCFYCIPPFYVSHVRTTSHDMTSLPVGNDAISSNALQRTATHCNKHETRRYGDHDSQQLIRPRNRDTRVHTLMRPRVCIYTLIRLSVCIYTLRRSRVCIHTLISVCCSVLQCVAVCCSVLWYVAVCIYTLIRPRVCIYQYIERERDREIWVARRDEWLQETYTLIRASTHMYIYIEREREMSGSKREV